MKHDRSSAGHSGRYEASNFGRSLHLADRIFPKLTFVFAILIVAILIGILIILNTDAAPAIQKFGASFLGSTFWDPVKQKFGALPAIYGTLLSSLIAMIIAVPVSLGTAIFLTELSPGWLRGPASLVIEMLAAIPSVIIGLWGLFVLLPTAITPLDKWLGKSTDFSRCSRVRLSGASVFSPPE